MRHRLNSCSALFVETEGNPFLAGEVLVDLVETNTIGVRDLDRDLDRHLDQDLDRLSSAVADRARRLRRRRGCQPG